MSKIKSIESIEAEIGESQSQTPASKNVDAVSDKDKIALGVRLMVDQVVSVETTSQSYTIVAGFGLDWEATDEDIENESKQGSSWRPRKTYSVNWLNNTNYEIIGEDFSIREGLNEFCHKKYVYYEVIFRGTFTNRFDCSSYPFDSQTLAFVCVGLNLSKGYFVPVRCRKDIFTVNTTYLAINDWNFVNYDIDIMNIDWGLAKTGNKSDVSKSPQLFYSTSAFVIIIKRKWYAQLIRTILWMFLLSVMIFLLSGIDPINIQDRLAYSIGILFAIIAFQFVISGHLPNLPYLTIIDKYNIFSLMLILFTSIEAYIVGYYDSFFSHGDIVDIDQTFYSFVFAFFILFHAGFMCYIKISLDKQTKGVKKYSIMDTPLKLQSVLAFDHTRHGLNDNDFANRFEY